jgi:hypothetical protein
LVTVIVYVTLVPGISLVALSVLAMARSACGVSVSVSVELLLPPMGSITPLGGLTVAVLLKEPVAEALMATVSWKLLVPFVARAPVVTRSVFEPAS